VKIAVMIIEFMKAAVVSRGTAAFALTSAFALGCITSHALRFGNSIRVAVRAPPPPSALEERGPPTKQELGQCGWTLIHTMAANFPETPAPRQRARAESFFRALGDLYPCPVCAAHFRGYMAEHPVQATSRGDLALWACGAHNEVNVRNGKEAFYCDIGVLDARWKDCGCEKNTSLH
jgi:hypothetical protein